MTKAPHIPHSGSVKVNPDALKEVMALIDSKKTNNLHPNQLGRKLTKQADWAQPLIGAGVGATLGGLTAKKKNRWSSALLGGSVGLGLGALPQLLKKPEATTQVQTNTPTVQTSFLSNLKDVVKDKATNFIKDTYGLKPLEGDNVIDKTGDGLFRLQNAAWGTTLGTNLLMKAPYLRSAPVLVSGNKALNLVSNLGPASSAPGGLNGTAGRMMALKTIIDTGGGGVRAYRSGDGNLVKGYNIEANKLMQTPVDENYNINNPHVRHSAGDLVAGRGLFTAEDYANGKWSADVVTNPLTLAKSIKQMNKSWGYASQPNLANKLREANTDKLTTNQQANAVGGTSDFTNKVTSDGQVRWIHKPTGRSFLPEAGYMTEHLPAPVLADVVKSMQANHPYRLQNIFNDYKLRHTSMTPEQIQVLQAAGINIPQ